MNFLSPTIFFQYFLILSFFSGALTPFQLFVTSLTEFLVLHLRKPLNDFEILHLWKQYLASIKRQPFIHLKFNILIILFLFIPFEKET